MSEYNDFDAKALFDLMMKRNNQVKEEKMKKKISFFTWLQWYLGTNIDNK